MAESRKDQLIETAFRLFQADGYRSTGINRILDEAGVAKQTLYNHFRTKDELILAALERWDRDSRRWLIDAMEARSDDPRERLLALFDVLDEWFASAGFRGCLFVNAAAEFGDPADPIHQAAADHKQEFREYLLAQARLLEVNDPAGLTEHIALLMEGAIVTAQVGGADGVAARARAAADTLIAAAGSAA